MITTRTTDAGSRYGAPRAVLGMASLIAWSCLYAAGAAAGQPLLSAPGQEHARTAFAYLVVPGFVAWLLAWRALVTLASARWRRWVAGMTAPSRLVGAPAPAPAAAP